MQETIPNMEKISRTNSSISDMRSYSTRNYENPPPYLDYNNRFKDVRSRKENNGGVVSSSSSNRWNYNSDPEFQRKKRVVAYKAYSVNGTMMGSVKRSFRWIKDSCSRVVHRLW
ncbi:hypothetical protein ABFX02_09G116700 [Erythranthe guttata]